MPGENSRQVVEFLPELTKNAAGKVLKYQFKGYCFRALRIGLIYSVMEEVCHNPFLPLREWHTCAKTCFFTLQEKCHIPSENPHRL